MLYTSNVNTIDSTIKTNIDKWYEANILNTTEESKIDDDEIYCGDRSIYNVGSWDLNASSMTINMFFGGFVLNKYN